MIAKDLQSRLSWQPLGAGRCAGPFLFGRGSAADESNDLLFLDAKDCGEHRQAAGAVGQDVRAKEKPPRRAADADVRTEPIKSGHCR